MAYILQFMIILWLALSFHSPGVAAEVVLRSRVTLTGPVIRLDDVAELVAIEGDRREQLATTPILPMPAPGTRRYLRVVQLQDLLRSRGISLVGLHFSGSSQVEIQVAPSKDLKESTVSGNGRDPGLRSHGSVEDPLAIERGNRQTTGGQGRQEPVPLIQNQIVVVNRPIERGTVIQASDIETRTISQRLPFRAVSSMKGAIGKIARQTLRPEKPLLENQLQAPRLVERGEVVEVFARTSGVQVKVKGVAKQKGGLGDLILVETTDGRERYMARIVGLRQLEVYTTGASVSEYATLPERGSLRR